MAPSQNLISFALFATLLLLGEAAQLKQQVVSEAHEPESDVSKPVEQRLLLSDMILKDQDFALGGILSRHLLQSQPILCYGGQVQCPSGIAECYYPRLGCDGANDCSDGSDEAPAFCSTFQCASNLAKCPSNRCTLTAINIPKILPKQFLCDGIRDCRDNSDEDPAFCASFDCAAAGSVTCPGTNKQCIPLKSPNNTFPYPYYSLPGIPTTLCDGVKDCRDGSDEDPAFCAGYSCASNSFKCRNNQCIAGTKVCNGVVDCPDGGSDEDSALCGPGFNCSLAALGLEIPFNLPAHCPSGSGCYPGNGTNCDGHFNCFDHSDEDPKLCDAGPCRDGLTRCPSGSGCYYGQNVLCNGYYDCADKSDESADVCANVTCPSGTRKCPSGQGGCLDEYKLCDGNKDCIDGSDESDAFCRTYDCGTARVRCPGGVGCVAPIVLCDGIPGNGASVCPNGSDEDPAFCAGKPCPFYGVRCRDGVCRQGNLCDGRNDCSDGSDEDPSYCQATPCSFGRSKCANNIQCVSPSQHCDGTYDCPDRSDEDPAFCKTFDCVFPYRENKCPGGSGQCFNNQTLCDGVKDCLDGSDEDPSFCASYQCLQSYFKCPGTNVCVYGKLCDGNKNCPDGSDESDAICRSGAQTSSPTGTPALTTKAPSPTTSSPSNTPTLTTGAPSPTTQSPSITPASTTGAPSPTTQTPSNTPALTTGPPSPTTSPPSDTPNPTSAPSGTVPPTTGGPSPAPCDPNSATPNQCFNAQGNGSVCCPGQCPEVPTNTPTCALLAPGPAPGPCDPTSSLPNQCFNANGNESVCCPGNCPQNPGPSAICG